MPSSYDDTRGPSVNGGWRKASNYKGADGALVNLWIQSSGFMSDEWEVPEAWRKNGRWFHVHNGREMEIHSHMVTHYRPVRVVSASPPERLPSTP